MSQPDLVRLSEVKLDGVGKRVGAGWAVRDVSIEVRPGELYAVLGPAGSGKTTLLRMIAGLVAPDAGHIALDDERIDHVPARQRNVGLVFTRYALWPDRSAFENVAFGLRARGKARVEIERAVRVVLAQVGFDDGALDRRPPELSIAEQYRVALARALVTTPRLLLLDDPLAGVEASSRVPLRLELARLQKDLAITTLFATRDQAQALALSSRIAVLFAGSVVQEGRPEDIYWKPRSRAVAEAMGPANVIAVRVVELREVGVVVETDSGARVAVASGGHPWTVGARGLLCLRPEALRVEEEALAPGGIPGTVVSQSFEGARQLYQVDIAGETLRVEMSTSVQQSRVLKPGDHVKVEVSAETSVLLPDERETPRASSR